MRRLTSLLVLFLAPAVAAAAAPAGAPKPKQEKAEGYLDYRQGNVLIVDGQKVKAGAATRLKLNDEARDLGSIPLGYEVKAKGVRGPDGTLQAAEIEVKKNGSALFEKDVLNLTDQAEAEYRRAGRYFNNLSNGRTETVGWMFDRGDKVERARRLVDALLPGYLEPSQVRVYVIENREWNAFAMGNYSIYVFSGLLDDLDDDELAIVLGHELAHATHEHTRRQFKKAMWIQLVALGLSGATTEIDDKTARAVAQLLIIFGAQAWQNGYGRDMEDQADRVGLRYAYEAGYDITKGPRLWQRFARKYGESGKVANFFFGNHSLSSQRAVNLERQIAFNYPDGPKEGVRLATSVKTPAGGRQADPLPGPLPPLSNGGSQRGSVPQNAAALNSGSGNAGPGKKEIRPGMNATEVRALLGKPLEEISFGAKSSWRYPSLTVVFENGRVAEVKF
jgi:Zn-dependent protease with chaperone function